MQQYTVAARSSRAVRVNRLRPAFYLPLALFCVSIVGGLAVLVSELPAVSFF